MTTFTRIGVSLWDWEPFTDLPVGPRMLWLALYTSAQAKSAVPGLWRGSFNTMAEAAHLPSDETLRYLDQLLEAEMVEYDVKRFVLRMTQLPDAGEYPTAPTIILSWWSKFNLVPPCAVRDAHVPVVRWILERGAAACKKNRAKKPTPLHEEIWASTFGTVVVPSPRRRGMRRLLDADTGTDVQPSLFGDRSVAPPSPTQSSVLAHSQLPSGSDSENNDFNRIYTHSSGYGEGEGVGVGAFSFRNPDTAVDRDHQLPRRLHLVPPPALVPFSVVELAEAMGLSGQPAVDPVLEAEIVACRAVREDLAKVRGYFASYSLGERIEVMRTPGRLPDAFARARRWFEDQAALEREAAERQAEFRIACEQAGINYTVKGTT